MKSVVTADQVFKFLERLKKAHVLTLRSLNGDDIYCAERLVDLGLASKKSYSHNSFYYYGIPEEKDDEVQHHG